MNAGNKTIVLIHGLWLTPISWDPVRNAYESKGYEVLTPPWPHITSVEDIRRDPSVLDGLGIIEIADHYEKFIRALDEPPILMGHSFGGLIVQILLDRGLGSVGVAFNSASPQGVLPLPFTVLKALGPALANPLNYWKTVTNTFPQFQYAFANVMPEKDARWVYDKYTIPGPGRPLFQAATGNINPWAANKVNFHNNDRAPLLLIAASEDHLCPPKLIKINYEKYAPSTAITGYKEFPNRSHLMLAQEGWQEVADYALNWAQDKIKTP